MSDENENDDASMRQVDEEGDDNSPDTPMATEEYELVIDGFRCPDEWLTMFTPLDFEEVGDEVDATERFGASIALTWSGMAWHGMVWQERDGTELHCGYCCCNC